MVKTPAEQADGGSCGHNRDFVRLWTGGAVSGLGSSLAALAYPLLALSVTRSAGAAGLLGLVALASGAVMRLPAGVLIDRTPLRAVLVGSDLIRALTTAAVALSLVLGRLTLGQLLAMAVVNGFSAVFSDTTHSVALRHVVPAPQLPRAFALNDGRGHAISLAGQPLGGFLYGVAPPLSLIADSVSFAVSAILSATIRHPLHDPTALDQPRPQLRHDLLTGLRFLLAEPFLRATLLAAAGYQLVFAAATFALVANFTGHGVSPARLGLMFAIAAAGGMLGAVTAPLLQARLAPHTLVVLMGWTATLVFAACAVTGRPLLVGALLGCLFLVTAPANAVLSAAQIERTPEHLQGRVMAASFLIAGLVAPLGPPASGVLLDRTGQAPTFVAIACLTGAVTITTQLNRSIRAYSRPGGDCQSPSLP